MVKVVKLPIQKQPKIFRSKKPFYTCDQCHRKYIVDLMINYLPSNYGYYSDEGIYHCIKCWNNKFYV